MLLSVSDLHKSYAGPDGHLPVLRGIQMLLARGETLALTGESGSGKSTLLHIIGGLDQPDSGIVAVVSWPPKTVPVFVDQWSGKEWHGNGIRMRTH